MKLPCVCLSDLYKKRRYSVWSNHAEMLAIYIVHDIIASLDSFYGRLEDWSSVSLHEI